MDYRIEGTSISASETFTHPDTGAESTVWCEATNIRTSRTGVHARITVGMAEKRLGYSEFNVDRDGDRTRLSNSAHRAIGNHADELLEKASLKSFIDGFCYGLWDAKTGEVEIEEVSGDVNAPGIDFLLAPWLIRNGGHSVFALPGMGKSTTALGMAITVDAGIGSPFGQGSGARVLYINLERSKESMAKRIALMNVALGLPPERALWMVNKRGSSLSKMKDAIARIIKEKDIQLVVLDSLSRAGMGSLKDDDAMNEIMDILNSFEIAWLTVAHTAKSDSSTSFGSVMQTAAVDAEIRLESEKAETGEMGVRLTMTKANDIPKSKPVYVLYTYTPDGIESVKHSDAAEYAALPEKKAVVGRKFTCQTCRTPKETFDTDENGKPRCQECSLNAEGASSHFNPWAKAGGSVQSAGSSSQEWMDETQTRLPTDDSNVIEFPQEETHG